MEGAVFAALKADIKANGLRDPIIIHQGAILDGRNRYRACKEVGVRPRTRAFTGDDPLAFVVSVNLQRRHLDESQRALVAARLANMREGRPDKTAQNCAVSQGTAADMLNVARRTVQSARVVLDKGSPDLVRAVESGKVAVSVAAKIAALPPDDGAKVLADPRPEHAIKKVARANKERDLAHKQCALPDQRFGVIYADPEWRFEVRSENGEDRGACNHYPTSSTDDIAARDVASIAADDCVLFLWATAPMLPDALRVMAAWGFEYKSQFVWVKDRAGTGYWNRNRHEILLVGTRGHVPAPAMGEQSDSVIEAPAFDHSEKPEKVAELIERYFPNLPKIELNRRGPARAGWSAWGNEARAA